MRKWMTVVAACVLAACGGATTVTGPSETGQTPVAEATPAPAQPAAPPVSPTTPSGGWAVECTAGSRMTVGYSGSSDRADVETYYTSFDNQNLKFGLERRTVERGSEFTRVFPTCVQSDVDPLKGNSAGHCYFDINGQPFSDPKSPKVQECRDRCVPEQSWEEEKERTYGEWLPGPAPNTTSASTQNLCVRYEHRLIIVWEHNTCTKARREKSRRYEQRTIEGRLWSRLRLLSDPNLPSSGNSFFNYHVYGVNGSEDSIPGVYPSPVDSQVYDQKLPKNTAVYIDVPPDGRSFYAFYDGEIANRDRAKAECKLDSVQAEWHVDLRYECGCDFGNN